MHEDAGRVEHAAQRRPPRSCELLEHEFGDRAGVRSRRDVHACPREDRPGGGDREVVRLGREPLVTEQLVDGGQVAQLHAESVGTSSRRSAVTRAGSPRADLEHGLVLDLLRQDAGRHVRDDREPEDADTHVARRDDLLHRRHPHEVAADRPHEADLRGRLELRPEPRDVHALADVEPEPLGGCPGTRTQLRVVRVAHVGEAGSQRLVVRPDERRGALQVDVIRDEDELAGPEVRR